MKKHLQAIMAFLFLLIISVAGCSILKKEIHLGVRVANTDENHLEGARVVLHPLDGSPPQIGYSNKWGNVHFYIPPGDYELIATKEGYLTTVTGGSFREEQAFTIIMHEKG